MKMSILTRRVFRNSSPTYRGRGFLAQGGLKEFLIISRNAVESVCFTRNPRAHFADVPNVFTFGDIVEADCNDASVYLMHAGPEEGHIAAQYGALENDWEEFMLQKRTNYIETVWSEWVNPEYIPTVTILYNEVFI